MKSVAVIPARFASTRFPGKPLVLIAGKPMIEWVVQGALESQLIGEVIVATDHSEIASVSKRAGARAVLTDPKLPSGSDRVYSAIQNEKWDLVVNIQGDEPLVNGKIVDALIQPFFEDSSLKMATLGTTLSFEDLENRNVVKIILNKKNEAIYFSRFPMPYSRIQPTEHHLVCLKHLGMYAYKKEFLGQFCAQPPADIENYECLEQLRALYLGEKIKVVKTDFQSIGVDVPSDVEKVEAYFSKVKGI